MQTFLPYEDYDKSALYLDPKRRNNQQSENLVILESLRTGAGWINHPATRMWMGYSMLFLAIGVTIGYMGSLWLWALGGLCGIIWIAICVLKWRRDNARDQRVVPRGTERRDVPQRLGI